MTANNTKMQFYRKMFYTFTSCSRHLQNLLSASEASFFVSRVWLNMSCASSSRQVIVDTPTSPVTSGLPLFFVITVTAIKQVSAAPSPHLPLPPTSPLPHVVSLTALDRSHLCLTQRVLATSLGFLYKVRD